MNYHAHLTFQINYPFRAVASYEATDAITLAVVPQKKAPWVLVKSLDGLLGTRAKVGPKKDRTFVLKLTDQKHQNPTRGGGGGCQNLK